MTNQSVPKTERLRIARTLALKEAEERFNNELLPDEERLEILDRIKRLKSVLAGLALVGPTCLAILFGFPS